MEREIKSKSPIDKEILEIDFYDFLGSHAIWYSDKEKIKYYREVILRETLLTSNP